MGCDIHMYVEVKRASGEHWEPVRRTVEVGDRSWRCESREIDWYPWRNYRDFAQLANVRNYGDETTPIAEPRGIPETVTSYVRHEFKEWGVDAHSVSYFTLADLKDVAWAEGSNMPFVLAALEELRWGDVGWPADAANVRLVFWFDN